MIAADRRRPSLDVPPWRIAQHLGLPRDGAHHDRWAELIDGARQWCRLHMTPWRGLRYVSIVGVSGSTLELETGHELNSPRLADELQAARGRRLAVLALSAGRSIDGEIRRRWHRGHPDQAMALHAFAAGWVEEWREREGDRLRRALAPRGLRVLSYLSPGYDGWPLTDQPNLFAVVSPLAGPIEMLDSGFLRPVRSTIAAFGLAPSRALDRACDGSGSGRRPA